MQQVGLPAAGGGACGGGAEVSNGKAWVRFVLFVAFNAVQFNCCKSVAFKGLLRDAVILAAVQLVAKLVLPTVTTKNVVLLMV